MTAPLWFLDVDGVINAAGRSDQLSSHLLGTTATSHGIDWPIHYDPAVIAAINRLHRDGLVEVRWLTTWCQEARTSLAPAVGLDGFAAYDEPDSDGWWKADVTAPEIVGGSRPVIWTDDDLTDDDLRVLADAEAQVLAIAPLTHVGLTTDHMRQIEAFARQPHCHRPRQRLGERP